MKITSINPSTNERLGEVLASSEQEVIEAVKSAHEAKLAWKELGIEGRNKALGSFYSLLDKNQNELAQLQAKEMGMPISQAKEDVEFGIAYLSWYSEHAEKHLSPEVTYEDDNEIHTVYHEPLGVVGVILPWNFPMSNFVWKCGQSLISGNVIVMKHSEEIPLFAERLRELVVSSKIPQGVFQIVQGDGKTGKVLVDQPLDMLAFKGSSDVGRYIYQKAAEKFIPVVMELGGSAPGIVFKDADVNKVVGSVMFNRFGNCGQICDGLKRLIVHTSKKNEVVTALKKAIDGLIVGDASDQKTELGPLVSERQLKALEEQVQNSVSMGAQIVTGGKRKSDMTGSFYSPTLIEDVTATMPVWNEEVFGPVLPVMTFETEEEAITLANDNEFGLGGYVFTEDKNLADLVAKKMETGMVSHNEISYLRECKPFGGNKLSGLGRENVKYGFDDVTQVKVVAREK